MTFLPRNTIFTRSWQNFERFFCHETPFLPVRGKILSYFSATKCIFTLFVAKFGGDFSATKSNFALFVAE